MKKEPGHPPLLQTIVSSRAGHKAPPFSGFTLTSRSLILVPPLQVALHLPHGFQSPTLQSTGNVKLWWGIQEQIFVMMATMHNTFK